MSLPLAPLLPLLESEPGLRQVAGRRLATLAVPTAARAISLAALGQQSERSPYVVIVPTTAEAERLAKDIGAFCGNDQVDVFAGWETLPFERVSPSVETMGRRMRSLWRLQHDAPKFFVTSVRALIQRLSPDAQLVAPLTVQRGDSIDVEHFVQGLVAFGYRREIQVEHRGEFAVRGSIVDVYPSTADSPFRIDLWGDEVDRLTEFAVATQRTTQPIDAMQIFPARELLPTENVRSRAEQLIATEPWGREQWEKLSSGFFFEGMESWLPWLADGDAPSVLQLLSGDAQLVLVEPRRLRDRANDIRAEEQDLAKALATTWDVDDETFPMLHIELDNLLEKTDAPMLTVLDAPDSPDTAAVEASGWGQVVGDGSQLVQQLQNLLAEGWTVTLAAEGSGSADRLQKLMAEKGVELDYDEREKRSCAEPGGHIVVSSVDRGFRMPAARVALLTEADITGRRRAHRQAKPRNSSGQGHFDDLSIGDYVVHYQHGVARYGGMVQRAISGVERDYLLLEYRGDDRLYVPSDQIDAVRPYTGGDSPSLSRLGTGEWQRAKARVRQAVTEIAQELVVLYQRRVHTPGHAFALDTPWQSELEESFPYELTPDQKIAVDAIKGDMESTSPMDRLLCGDVGFGKTEVALRAVFKAVQDGYQSAVLVPTTLLAQQHFQTFSERFAGFPVRVEVLSRFLTASQAKNVIEAIKAGEVDVVIGTHRLLGADIEFKNLGLLVVDEEQRFGVNHKEAIKAMRVGVDVLTLSATPIPRTLEMSLTGIRDLTLLNTPPAERQPILTYVGEYDDRAVAEAIRRELLRDGQVFYVHNRVQSIEKAAAHLRELVPEARIAVAHGQLDEGTLESTVLQFWEGEFDVLVCTTIIESGIDMPTVNTLVVERADLLGLGQLHQLRGRVGRSQSRAYAYLFYPPDRSLSEQAYERLKTIGEATELGSGFRIAMRDLELRGAGNLLGTGQSGHIAAVGYDLYCQMVTEAVAELKGEPVAEPAEIKLELPLDANIPSDYIEREDQRLDAYRRLASVRGRKDVDDVREEWLDRYGPIPAAAEALLSVAKLRAECVRLGITDVLVAKGPSFGGPKFLAKVSPVQLLASATVRLGRLYKGAIYKAEIGQLQLPLRSADALVDDLVSALGDLMGEGESAETAVD